MRLPALLLALWAPLAQAEHPMCVRMKPLAREMRPVHEPSNPYYVNCGPGQFSSSNYSYETPADAPMEMHVIGVHEGSFPPGQSAQGGDEPTGAVQVFVYKTEKPVLLVLSAYAPVLWDLTLTQDARVERIVLQGRREQRLIGVPKDIPVVRRPHEQTCGYAYGWEDRMNHYGGNYRMMIQSLRCSTGLRETSFQGCYSGAVFEIPYYRKGPAPKKAVDWSPPCPLTDPELTARAPASAPAAPHAPASPAAPPRPEKAPERPPRQETPARKPAGPKAEEELPSDATLDEDFGAPPKSVLGRPAPTPERSDIPIRALAILLEGNRALATHDAIPDLIEALQKGDTLLKSRAADAIGRFGPAAAGAVDALMAALKDPSDRVRSSAALALGNIGPDAAKSVNKLKNALESDNADLRVSAETALERIGTERALKILLRHRRGRGLQK